MKKNLLGQTGLSVTELCFGVLPAGPLQANIPAAECINLLKEAIDLGINFIDTAEMYKTQEYVGEAIKGKRDQLILATKSTAETYEEMEKSIQKSLKEFGVDYIDIFHLHAARADQKVFEQRASALECLQAYKQKGVIKAIGISTHAVDVVETAAGRPEIDVVFPIINKAGLGIIGGTTEMMLAAIEKVVKSGKGIYAMKALGGGNLLDDIIGAFDFVRKIPGMQSIAVGMVKREELLVNYKIFNGQPVSQAELANLTGKKNKRLVVLGYCKACGKCVATCPNGALSIVDGKAFCEHNKCLLCGYCSPVCPEFALRLV